MGTCGDVNLNDSANATGQHSCDEFRIILILSLDRHLVAVPSYKAANHETGPRKSREKHSAAVDRIDCYRRPHAKVVLKVILPMRDPPPRADRICALREDLGIDQSRSRNVSHCRLETLVQAASSAGVTANARRRAN